MLARPLAELNKSLRPWNSRSKAWVPRGSHALTVSRLAFAVQLSEKFGIDANRPQGAVMPLFYFDVRDGQKLMRDDDGLEFPTSKRHATKQPAP